MSDQGNIDVREIRMRKELSVAKKAYKESLRQPLEEADRGYRIWSVRQNGSKSVSKGLWELVGALVTLVVMAALVFLFRAGC